MRLFALSVIFVYLVFQAMCLPIGDHLVSHDQLTQAKTLYQAAKLSNPFNPKIDQALTATDFLISERKGNAEESGGDESLLKNPKLLGVAAVNVPVLMYHYIRVNPDPGDSVGFNLSVTPYDFDNQMKYLKDHDYHPITMDELGDSLSGKFQLPQKPVIITFDDSYRDCYTQAFPILKKYGFKAVSFVVTGFLGGPNYMTWDQIKEMSDSGLFYFGSHTIHHPSLVYLSDQEVEKEVTVSKKDLEDHLGKEINWFAYPFGNVDDRVAAQVKKAGYIGAFGTNNGTFQDTTFQFTRPRVRVGGGEGLNFFASTLPWH